MSNQINPAKKSLTIKDLVTTGIFSAIFLVFTLNSVYTSDMV